MSIDATLAAWSAWLASQPAPISTPLRFTHSPPWPYEGAYPYVLILPRTQSRERYSSAEVVTLGWWRLLYVDVIGATYTSVSALLANATAWAEATIIALQQPEPNPSRTLNGAVAYAGEGGDGGGPGAIIAFDDKQALVDTNNIPCWALPLDVYVHGRPEPG